MKQIKVSNPGDIDWDPFEIAVRLDGNEIGQICSLSNGRYRGWWRQELLPNNQGWLCREHFRTIMEAAVYIANVYREKS
jgi:hypothetical protein